ncbi:hypothetical protein TIFTF001_028807 [Ficus carica]|uniref:Uncharacterized protein n=1 Tax=Ficus carica TaxID=3494 RepID=A0AA88DQM3_FICCA|nr:hypothetical protein TIFTF001_028807 [Ficus carica]
MIPWELGSLMKLVGLELGINNLTGVIPASFGNISSLRYFLVEENKLMGTIPHELGRLKRLTVFNVDLNNLSGEIPLSLYNMSSMRSFSVIVNHFKGTLPPNIGCTLPNLQHFVMGGNEFSGMIPASFANATRLQLLDVIGNGFFGQVPTSLGSLPDLRKLGLDDNSLGNYSANSLDFIPSLINCSQLENLGFGLNKFGGALPNSIANLSTRLTMLYLEVNQISGNIPATLENLVNLMTLSMSDNLFTGDIPASLGKLRNLQALHLNENTLSGKIPSSMGNLTRMFELYLDHNRRNYGGDNGGIEIEVEEDSNNFENRNRISAHLQKCLVSILQIGLACSEESPNERINIGDVTRELQHIRKAYLDVDIRGQRNSAAAALPSVAAPFASSFPGPAAQRLPRGTPSPTPAACELSFPACEIVGCVNLSPQAQLQPGRQAQSRCW